MTPILRVTKPMGLRGIRLTLDDAVLSLTVREASVPKTVSMCQVPLKGVTESGYIQTQVRFAARSLAAPCHY